MNILIFVLVLFSLALVSNQQGQCEKKVSGLEKAVECLDKKLSQGKADIDKKNEQIKKQKSTPEPATSDPNACPKDWTNFGNGCYQVKPYSKWEKLC